MSATSFRAEYEPLSPRHPEWGKIALLPWDSGIFGFPVADYQPGEPDILQAQWDAFRRSFNAWTRRQGVRIVSSSVDLGNASIIKWLSRAGFDVIDVSLRVTLSDLHRKVIPDPRVAIRTALPEDRGALERIAGSVFRHGRYHADVRFPRELADRRYRSWIGAALDAAGQGEQVLVAGPPGDPKGFFHVALSGHMADLRLWAVDTASERGMSGRALCAGSLRWVCNAGIRQITAKISAANMPVVNLHSSLRFVFSRPEAVLHWHAGHEE